MIIDFRNFGNFANMIHKKRIRKGSGGFLLKSPEIISKINEVQLGLIVAASLVSSVEVKQVKKVDLFFCSHWNGTVRYRTTSVHKEQNGTIYNVPISASLFCTA